MGGTRNEDGTANLAGYDLPVDRVAAACDRFDRLAKAAKHAGHPDPIDHIRADLFLGMTDGTYAGLTDPQILTRLLIEANLTQPAPAQPAPAQPAPAQPAPAQPAPGQPAPSNPHRPTPHLPDPRLLGRAAGPRLRARAVGLRLLGSAPAGSAHAGSAHAGADGDGAAAANASGNGYTADGETRGDTAGGGSALTHGGELGPAAGGLRLLVGLATLAWADARPGELIGHGPVHAELARSIAAASGASWWYVVTGVDGTQLANGQVRSGPRRAVRPAAAKPRRRSGCGSTATLRALAQRCHPPGWQEVITEITIKAEADAGPPNGDPSARLPGTLLRRWLQVRDRTSDTGAEAARRVRQPVARSTLIGGIVLGRRCESDHHVVRPMSPCALASGALPAGTSPLW